MTIQYKPLDDQIYRMRSFDVILKVESKDYNPYLCTSDYPTIGIGFKIEDNWEAREEKRKKGTVLFLS